jgi:hypothetical protein
MITPDTDNLSFYTYQLGDQGTPKEGDGRFVKGDAFFNESNWAASWVKYWSAVE